MARKPKAPDAAATLFDRLAIAFASGLFALVLGSAIWFALMQIGSTRTSLPLLPFRYVLWFAAGMAALGFALLENLLAELFAALLRLIQRLGRWV